MSNLHPSCAGAAKCPLKAATFGAMGLLVAALLLSGCTDRPDGENLLRRQAAYAGRAYRHRFRHRALPPLAAAPTLRAVITRALLANGSLENTFWKWKAAIEQIPQDGTQTAPLAISGGTAINNGNLAWNSTTLGALNDPMTDIYWPAKVTHAAQRALDMAQASAKQFRAQRFAIRKKVVTAWYAYARDAALAAVDQQNVALLKMIDSISSARVSAGRGGEQDLLRARTHVALARNGRLTRLARLPGDLATLNALLDRPPAAPLRAPHEGSASPTLRWADARLLGMLPHDNLQLAALRRKLAARRESLTLAKLKYYPNFDVAATTDLAGMVQNLSGVVTIPITRYKAINAAIRQARDNIRAQRAVIRQTGDNLAARLVLDLALFHDAGRQVALLKNIVLPQEKMVVNVERAGYSNGRSSFIGLMRSQSSLLTIQSMLIDQRTAMQLRIADMEAILARRLTPPDRLAGGPRRR